MQIVNDFILFTIQLFQVHRIQKWGKKTQLTLLQTTLQK